MLPGRCFFVTEELLVQVLGKTREVTPGLPSTLQHMGVLLLLNMNGKALGCGVGAWVCSKMHTQFIMMHLINGE